MNDTSCPPQVVVYARRGMDWGWNIQSLIVGTMIAFFVIMFGLLVFVIAHEVWDELRHSR